MAVSVKVNVFMSMVFRLLWWFYMDKSFKVVLAVVIAVIVAAVMYYVTPPSWPAGDYSATVYVVLDEGTVSVGPLKFELGPGVSGVFKSAAVSTVVGGKNVTVVVDYKSGYKLELGSNIVFKVKVEGVGKQLSLDKVYVEITAPDGRVFKYFAGSCEGNEYVIEVKPYVKIKEVSTVFGFIVTLFIFADVIPYVITGLLVPLLLYTLGVFGAKPALANFMHPIIMVFLGGSALELAFKESGLDRRIARAVVRFGRTPEKFIVLLFIVGSFLSWWMSNTAATYVMLPLVLSTLAMLRIENTRFATIAVLILAFATSIGGSATIIGTPPNLMTSGLLEEFLGVRIEFYMWMIWGLPVWFVGITIGIIVALLYWRFTAPPTEIEIVRRAFERGVAVEAAGKLSSKELLTLVIFAMMVTLWMIPGLLNVEISSGMVGLLGLVAFFASGVLKVKEHFRKLSWDLLVLFGAGLTLGSALLKSGWSEWVLSMLYGLRGVPPYVLFLAVAISSYLFGTFVSSHTSAAAIITPIIIPLGSVTASVLGMDPVSSSILLTMVAVFSLNAATALPISTPPSAIVYSSGKVKIKDLATYGMICGLLVVTIVALVMPAFWTAIHAPPLK